MSSRSGSTYLSFEVAQSHRSGARRSPLSSSLCWPALDAELGTHLATYIRVRRDPDARRKLKGPTPPRFTDSSAPAALAGRSQVEAFARPARRDVSTARPAGYRPIFSGADSQDRQASHPPDSTCAPSLGSRTPHGG